MNTIHASSRRRGYILITTALLLTGLIAATGLSVDLGRMYIARNEAQTFVDAGALAAALEIDGTAFGITNARNAALTVAKRYDMHTRTFAGTTVYFSTSSAGPWEENPANPATIRHVRVLARTSIPVFLIPGAGGNAGAAAVASAGHMVQSSFSTGLFPMSPFAVNEAAAENGGLVPGQIYALRWGSNNNKMDQLYDPRLGADGGACPGDFNLAGKHTVNSAKASPSSRRGYYAPFHSSSEQADAIVNDDTGGLTIAVGDTLNAGPGGHNSNGNAIQTRISQDTDSTSASFATYQANRVNGRRLGNGRRIVGVPINSGPLGSEPYDIVAIGAFFLLPSNWYNAYGNQPYCAEFIGPWVQGSKNPGAGTGGSFALRLTE